MRPLRIAAALWPRLGRRPTCVLAFSSAHASFWEKGAWLMMARARRIPFVVMLVDGNFPSFYDGLPAPLKALARGLLERSATVVVQTASWLRYFEGIAPEARYVILSNGVDVDAFQPVERPPRSRPEILYVGWLIPEKGIFELLEAARGIRARGIDFVLTLVGPPHGYENDLRARIAELGLADHVILGGVRRGRDEIRAAYGHADIFVLPSWAEGLPNALLEAMACGLPPVVTSVGGMVDVVEHGVSGLLVPSRDAQALADALADLLTDETRRRRMGSAARLRVESAFRNDRFIEGLTAVLARE